MPSEETVIVVAAFAACGLLVLGVLELLWPTRPRRPARGRPRPGRAPRPHRTSALARHSLEAGRGRYVRRAGGPAPGAVPPAPLPLRAARPVPLPAAGPLPTPGAPAVAAAVPAVDAPLAAAPLSVAELGVAPVSAPDGPPVVDPRPMAEPSPTPPPPLPVEVGAVAAPAVETCFALHRERRHAEAVEAALAALTGCHDAQQTAALWSVIALARQAQDRPEEARAALATALEAAPEGDRPAYRRQLATLAEGVGRDLLSVAERHAVPDSEERLAALRGAVAWLGYGLAAAPADAGLAALAATARQRLWPAWERTVLALARRQEFHAARRLLREALADPDFPADRSEAFHALFSGTFSGEIGQLTAQAIRSVQDAREADALGALQRAETLLEALSDDALPPRRREEVDRRLWWGYRTLGERRLAAGEFDAALDPLVHALGYPVGPEQHEETRALLLRTLDGLADTRALGIRQLAAAGDREAAILQADALWAQLHADATGLSPAEMSGVYRKVQRLVESLGR